jgi:predicted N-acetyltransferase YhbS
MISPELRDFAESPEAYVTLPPGFQRVQNERFSLFLGPTPRFTSIQRVRVEPDELEATLAEVRDLVAGHDHVEGTWWLSDERLWERLRELGLKEPRHGEAELTAMALAEPPEPGPADVTAIPVETVEEYAQAAEIRVEAFGDPARDAAELAEDFRAEQEAGLVVTFVARLDGRVAGTASGIYCPRGGMGFGAATARWARGRGAYRAVVRARWDEAVRRGTPAFVTQGGTMSGPILRRVGFEDICLLRRLQDPA